MNLYGCVFEGKQENHIVRLFVGCITVECSFVETFLGHRLAVNFRSTGVSDTFFLRAELVSHRNHRDSLINGQTDLFSFRAVLW